MSSDRISDRELVAGYLARGEEAAFRQLYRRHAPALYSLVLRVLYGNRGDAEEVVHETWIRACEKLEGFRWESSLATWLCGIALNRCREWQRERLRKAPVFPVGGKSTVHPEPNGDLARLLDRLPEGQREVLLLHDLQGFSHAEIAILLGIEAGTSKSQLFHARRAVRALLQGADNE